MAEELSSKRKKIIASLEKQYKMRLLAQVGMPNAKN